MRLARGAFTLIELMVSISILSIMMIFLYQSYASLNASNKNLKNEITNITSIQKLKKVIYLDFSLALYKPKKSVKIENRNKREDAAFFQSSNSIHRRYNPYIAYIVKEGKLYRLESLKELKEYELATDSEFDVDYLGEVESFRVYKSLDNKKEVYLLHIKFKNFEDVLLKIKVLNEL